MEATETSRLDAHSMARLLYHCATLPVVGIQTTDISAFLPKSAYAIHEFAQETEFCQQMRQSLRQNGYAVLDFSSLAHSVDLLSDRTHITAVLTYLGTPFRIFDAWPLWKPIETKPDIEPWRAGGTGLIPLHMDFVNCEYPPEYTCLFCLTEDPGGAGKNTIGRIDTCYDALSESSKRVLCKTPFSDGAAVNLSNVGRDINPFHIAGGPDPWRFRFTGKAIIRMKDSPLRDAMSELEAILESESITLALRRFQVLIVDQRVAVHGRLPLAGDQRQLASNQRRLLHQIFIRAN